MHLRLAGPQARRPGPAHVHGQRSAGLRSGQVSHQDFRRARGVDPGNAARNPRSQHARTCLQPTRGAPTMTRQYASLLPLDVGFDLRVTKHSVRLSTLPLRYLDHGGRQQVTSPDPESAADVLARAGYSVVAFLTANGRDVQCTPANDAPPGATVDVDPDATPGFTWTGPVWSVQARQDNYWCNGPSLVSAPERPVGPSPTCDPSVSRRQCKRLA